MRAPALTSRRHSRSQAINCISYQDGPPRDTDHTPLLTGNCRWPLESTVGWPDSAFPESLIAKWLWIHERGPAKYEICG
jgi:hypothetical protein